MVTLLFWLLLSNKVDSALGCYQKPLLFTSKNGNAQSILPFSWRKCSLRLS